MFALVDWFICTFLTPGRLWFYLAIRAIGMVPLMLAFSRLHSREAPGPTELRFIDAGLCGALTILIGLTSVELGGIASPIVLGAFTILIARSALLVSDWRRGLMPVGTIVVAYPATLILLAALVPRMAAQFGDPNAVAFFVLNQAFLIAAGAIVLIGGHFTWSLRRQVLDQRALGRYKLERRIGEGGMGEVWAATCSALKRDVAVKILRPEKVTAENVARFEREVRATAELSHPNTVRVFDYGATEDGVWYYAMELLEGQDLRDLVVREGPLAPARAVKLMWQASRALAEAHQRGIFHRDIKPENLFVTDLGAEGDFLKVLDFGLAKLIAGEGSADLTDDGFAVGTPRYVSPEVLFGNQADARSDVYGLGAVLYFCLCGRPPFDYEEPRRNFLAHMNEEPLPPSKKLGRRLPAAVEAVVMQCLSKEPADRFADAGELAAALEQAALVTSTIATRPVVKRPTPFPHVAAHAVRPAGCRSHRTGSVVLAPSLRPLAQSFETIDVDTFDIEEDGTETLVDHQLPVFE
jgi:serine/threonine-protein kinase